MSKAILIIMFLICILGIAGFVVIAATSLAEAFDRIKIAETIRELSKGETMKTKDIGCEFCSKFNFATASVEIRDDKAFITLGLCNTRFPEEEQFKFCPICGKQLREDKRNEKDLTEANTYCLTATLECLDEHKQEKGEYFYVPFRVLAENVEEAEKMLREWLSKPEQTGYTYKKCMGIMRETSDIVLTRK